MVFLVQNCFRNIRFLFEPSKAPTFSNVLKSCYHCEQSSHVSGHQIGCLEDCINQSDIDIVISKVPLGSTDSQVFHGLAEDEMCKGIQLSHTHVIELLHRFKDDWKSALGVFRWAESRSDYKHTSEIYNAMVDVLGKAKQLDRMRLLLDEMRDREGGLVTLDTIGKAMRRFSGAGHWENAVRIFDDLKTFGLEKNIESMNVLLDTLCKEGKVEQSREIFLELKPYIPPNENTFNIFIHGWCKSKRVEEAYWTIEEMKGYGFQPSVISYSTIIQFYCHQTNFLKVYELLDEMEAQGCIPNVVTYTTVMCSLVKLEKFEEALQIPKRMESVACKPDTLFYNALIHALGRAGKYQEAVRVLKIEMPKTGVVPNTSTYNSIIAMFCHRGLEQQAFDVFEEMKSSKLCKPDLQTYYPLLKSCLKSGKIDDHLRNLLDEMANKHHLSLDISAYKLLIHGLCRRNKCEWAYLLFEEMIGKDMTPRYQTCRLLLDEVRQKNLYDAAEKIEDIMKKL